MTPKEWKDLGILGRYVAYKTLEQEVDALRNLLRCSYEAREKQQDLTDKLLDRLERRAQS